MCTKYGCQVIRDHNFYTQCWINLQKHNCFIHLVSCDYQQRLLHNKLEFVYLYLLRIFSTFPLNTNIVFFFCCNAKLKSQNVYSFFLQYAVYSIRFIRNKSFLIIVNAELCALVIDMMCVHTAKLTRRTIFLNTK